MGFLVTTTIIGTVGSSAVSTVSSRTTDEEKSTTGTGTGTDTGGMNNMIIWVGLAIGIGLAIIIFKLCCVRFPSQLDTGSRLYW